MKKRRFLSLTLALALTASLSAPAFAAEGEYGFTVDGEPVETISADAQPEEYYTVDVADLAGEPLDPSQIEVMPIPVEGDFDPAIWQQLLENRENDGLLIAPNPFAGEDEEDFDYAAYQARQVEEYRATHPGELEEVGITELLIRNGYSDPMAAYMEDWGYETEEEALTSLYANYVDEREWAGYTHETAEEYRADYPELWAAFDDAAYFAENYPWYTGVEFMRDNGLWTYAEFVDQLFVEYVDEQIPHDWDDWDWTPDLSLSVNGVTLWDSAIYAQDGVSYLPAGELNAILGTSYTEDTPIRDAAVDNGWDVTWNAGANQVVLLNKADITGDWDFTNFDAMMNRLLKGAGYEKGKPLHTKETADITLTRFNTLDGDEIHTFKITADTVMKDNLLNLTLTADLAQLLQMVPKATLDQMELQMPKGTFRNLKALLSGCKVQMILNLDTGMLYCNAPILALFDDTFTEKTWFSVEMVSATDAIAMDTVSDMLTGEWSTADYLYGILLSGCATMPYGAETSYQSTRMAGAMLGVMMGNEAVTEKNGIYTWKVDTAILDKMVKAIVTGMAGELGEEGLEQVSAVIPSMSDFFKEYNVTMTVDRNGKFTMSAAMRLDPESISRFIASQIYYPAADLGVIGGADGPTSMLVSGGLGSLMSAFDFRLTGESQGTAQHATGTAEFHVKNQFKMVIREVSNLVKDAPTVLSAPPAGAVILSVEDLF